MQFFLQDSLIPYKFVMLSTFMFSEMSLVFSCVNSICMDSRQKEKPRLILKEHFQPYISLFRKILKMSLPWLETLPLGMLVTPGGQNPPCKCNSEVSVCGGLGIGGGCPLEVLGDVCKSGRGETTAVQKRSPEGELMCCGC